MPAAVPTKEPVTLAREYKERIVPELQKSRGYKNVMEVPKIEKVVVNCSIR
jgi:large subunit ribosomal protein L5